MKKYISKHLEIEHLSNERQQKILKELQEAIQVKLTAKIIKILPADDKETYFKLLDQNNPDKTREFLIGKIEDYDQIAEATAKEVIDRFKEKRREQ